MSSLEADERLAASVAKTTNRVSPKDIQDAIILEKFFTADEAIRNLPSPSDQPIHPVAERHLKILTICILTFKNGFVQVGYSAPADPANYNKEAGQKFARDAAIRNAWPLFGFAMCNKLLEQNEAAVAGAAEKLQGDGEHG